MQISSFNINKFCGPYSSCNGGYYNPRNIDFRTPIKMHVNSLLKSEQDIFFMQEFIENRHVNVQKLFPEDEYKIFYNSKLTKSNVVAITLKNSIWNKNELDKETQFSNKYIEMESSGADKTKILCFHNTDINIETKIESIFESGKKDVILGDFNNTNWIKSLDKYKTYRDLVTNEMITYKPGQTGIDRVFIKNKDNFKNKIIFNGVIENFDSDHNLITFSLNI